MEFLEMGQSTLEVAAADVGGTLDSDADPAHQLAWLMSGPRADWANLHCVQVLTDCWHLATADPVVSAGEGPHGLAPATFAAFQKLAELCRLDRVELDWVLAHAAKESRTAQADAYRV
jgi:hypothetical protein